MVVKNIQLFFVALLGHKPVNQLAVLSLFWFFQTLEVTAVSKNIKIRLKICKQFCSLSNDYDETSLICFMRFLCLNA